MPNAVALSNLCRPDTKENTFIRDAIDIHPLTIPLENLEALITIKS